jgi:hypothetical protein
MLTKLLMKLGLVTHEEYFYTLTDSNINILNEIKVNGKTIYKKGAN